MIGIRVPKPIRVPIPGLRNTVGLGQVVKKLTTAVGVSPCAGCQRRASALDRRVVFTGPGSSGH
jgi:hypothetical protein